MVVTAMDAGDLKPENLLLADNNDNSVLKIADFGMLHNILYI